MATDEAWRLLLWAGAWVGVWADGLPHRHVLAPGFHVSWGFETRERLITFAVEAQTRGWVGLGLTRSGGMEGADMAVGWVKDGRQYFHDRYAVGNEQPLIDKSQDLTLLSLTQNGSHTLLKYRRPFRTCDSNDLDITDDTTQLIFACSSSLPSSISSLPMHDSVYGVKSVQILNYAPSDIPRLANASVLDILTNFTVPQTASFYSCKLEKFPDYGKKIHIYMVEPVIRTQDPDLIFQMILYGCPSAYGTSHLQLTEDCFANQASTNLYTACSSVLAVWGLGTSQSQPLIFPEEAGISLGALGDPEFYVLQIHYDNRRNASGVWDNSGFRIHLTSEIRENDLGILWTGIALFQTLLIPPKTSAYKTYGSCNTSPISQNSNQTSSEVKILAGHLHTHLLGRSVRVLQFRNGQQVSVVLEDKTFDPTLQEPKFAKEPVTVPRGGLDTIEEMCMSFLLYYPKFEIATCFSYQDSRTVANALGVSANSDSDLYNTLSSWNWTEKVTEDMQEKIRDAPQYLVMSGDNVDKDITSNTPSIPAERVSPCVRAQTSVSPHVTAPNLCSLIVLLIAWE